MGYAIFGCEESQACCIEFRKAGHEAYSCDTQPCSGGHPEWHFQMDIFKVIQGGYLTTQAGTVVYVPRWDLGVFFPPCTYLSNVAAKHYNILKYGERALDRWEKRVSAARFFYKLYSDTGINKVCIENPVGFINGEAGIPSTQIIQPYYFGDPHSKRTCLWLRNLPPLVHSDKDSLFSTKTHVHKGEMGKNGGLWMNTTEVINLPSDERSKARSKTFPSISKAMADQWGPLLPK